LARRRFFLEVIFRAAVLHNQLPIAAGKGMKTRPKKITKVIVKLELHPINSESERSLGSAFSDASKLVEICYRYFRGVLPARLVKEYPGLEKKDVGLLRLTAKRAGVRLPSDTVIETIRRVYTNFKTSGETFGTRPRSIRPFLPIRITKVTPVRERPCGGTSSSRATT
jgi:hypothetical protein